VFRCFEKDPARRLASAAELAQTLPAEESWRSAGPQHCASDGQTVALPAPRAAVSGARPKLDAARRRRKSQRVRRTAGESWEDEPTESQSPYDMLPLPRVLKPFAPWITSVVSLLIIATFSIVMQQCGARRLGQILHRINHTMSSQ